MLGRGKWLDSVSWCDFSRLKAQRGRCRKAKKNWERRSQTLAPICRLVELGAVDRPHQGMCLGLWSGNERAQPALLPGQKGSWSPWGEAEAAEVKSTGPVEE